MVKSEQHNLDVFVPPEYCEYAGGECDQSFSDAPRSKGLFLYPGEPRIIATTLESAKGQLISGSGGNWISWKDLRTEGQVIFCEICKAIRCTELVLADVTTLNLNLLLEVGYAIGLGRRVLPLRDPSFVSEKSAFDELGLLDTVGYLNFHNSADVSREALDRDIAPIPWPRVTPNKEQPLFLAKSHVHNEGMVRLMSALKKSGLYFRTFDPKETTRLSLVEAQRQVSLSFAVIVHLTLPDRAGARVHNARCAFLAGLALARQKYVLMLQEGEVSQPIDYRDIVRCYTDPTRVGEYVRPLFRRVIEELQESRFVATALPLRLLEEVDLGDLAAENEIKPLTSYFVPTGQYNEAKRGRARLVVGRKGAGKTAVFYGIRQTYRPSRAHLVLDLKPEGHQLIKLRESVLNTLTPGVQQHVLTAFWNYLLLMEIAHKIVATEEKLSYHCRERRQAFLAIAQYFDFDEDHEQADFSERLLKLVEEIVDRRNEIPHVSGTPEVTQLIYSRDIKTLSDSLCEYMNVSHKDDIWLLFDNLDKGWPVRGAKTEDILLLRSLLEASRKLQRQFEKRETECHTVLFIRNDIYEHLLRETPDRGKDTAVLLDWNDPEIFEEIIRRRIIHSTKREGDFEELWLSIFNSHVLGEETFGYILRRTLMRPREVLRFCRECIDVAVSRGHERVTEADVEQAERTYSEDAVVDVVRELRDVREQFEDVPYAFVGAPAYLSEDEVNERLHEAGITRSEHSTITELLLWFGFLGLSAAPDEERYSYEYQHNPIMLRRGIGEHFSYCIHPAFRKALGCA